MEMTTETFLEHMKLFKQCYDNQVKEAETELSRKREQAEIELSRKTKQALGIWAEQNAKYKIGDTLSALNSYDYIIKVDMIKGYVGIDGKPAILYHGQVLTKKLQPRKDRLRATIFENEKITKIETK